MAYQDPKHINEVDAKGGRKVKGMTTVLTISTISAVILMLGIYFTFLF